MELLRASDPRRRLVGKLDVTADRDAGVLRVDAVHDASPFTKTMSAAIAAEIKDLARWLRLDLRRTGCPDQSPSPRPVRQRPPEPMAGPPEALCQHDITMGLDMVS